MSKIKNGGLDQYGAEPFEQQQFGTAGVERVKVKVTQSAQVQVYTVLISGTNTSSFSQFFRDRCHQFHENAEKSPSSAVW